MNNEDYNKVGDLIFVMDDGPYAGQDMKWTEMMEPRTIEKGERLYHYSDYEIEEFRSKETCFFTSQRGFGYCYEFVAPRNMTGEMSPMGDEVRVELEEMDSLEYIGYRKYIRN